MVGIVEIRGKPASVLIDTGRGGNLTHYIDALIDSKAFWSRRDHQPLDGSVAEVSSNIPIFCRNYFTGIQPPLLFVVDSPIVVGAEVPFHGDLCRGARTLREESDRSPVTLRADLKPHPILSTRTYSVVGFKPSPLCNKQGYPPNADTQFVPSNTDDTLQLLRPDPVCADPAHGVLAAYFSILVGRGLRHIERVDRHKSHPASPLKSNVDRSSDKLLGPLGIAEATFKF